MKRSEMIELISLSCDTGEDEADYMLTIVERTGMAPPFKHVQAKPDPDRPGTMMHTSTERGWDEEK